MDSQAQPADGQTQPGRGRARHTSFHEKHRDMLKAIKDFYRGRGTPRVRVHQESVRFLCSLVEKKHLLQSALPSVLSRCKLEKRTNGNFVTKKAIAVALEYEALFGESDEENQEFGDARSDEEEEEDQDNNDASTVDSSAETSTSATSSPLPLRPTSPAVSADNSADQTVALPLTPPARQPATRPFDSPPVSDSSSDGEADPATQQSNSPPVSSSSSDSESDGAADRLSATQQSNSPPVSSSSSDSESDEAADRLSAAQQSNSPPVCGSNSEGEADPLAPTQPSNSPPASESSSAEENETPPLPRVTQIFNLHNDLALVGFERTWVSVKDLPVALVRAFKSKGKHARTLSAFIEDEAYDPRPRSRMKRRRGISSESEEDE